MRVWFISNNYCLVKNFQIYYNYKFVFFFLAMLKGNSLLITVKL